MSPRPLPFLELAGLPNRDSTAGGDVPGLAWLSWGFRGVDPFGPPGDFPADSISFVCEFLLKEGERAGGGIESRLPRPTVCSQYFGRTWALKASQFPCGLEAVTSLLKCVLSV